MVGDRPLRNSMGGGKESSGGEGDRVWRRRASMVGSGDGAARRGTGARPLAGRHGRQRDRPAVIGGGSRRAARGGVAVVAEVGMVQKAAWAWCVRRTKAGRGHVRGPTCR